VRLAKLSEKGVMQMDFASIACAPLDNRAYVVWDKNKTAVVIDPSMSFEEISALAKKEKLSIKLIVNTHGHHDHMFNNYELKAATGAQLCIHELDEYRLEKNSGETRPWLPRSPIYQKEDFTFKDGQVLQAGEVKLKVVHAPGHTEGSSCFVLEGGFEGKPVLFTGDTLFKGTFGRTDFPGGNETQMWQSLKLLSALKEDYLVLPGHGQQTNLSSERAWMEKLVKEKLG